MIGTAQGGGARIPSIIAVSEIGEKPGHVAGAILEVLREYPDIGVLHRIADEILPSTGNRGLAGHKIQIKNREAAVFGQTVERSSATIPCSSISLRSETSR